MNFSILIIDDEINLLKFLRDFLRKEGYTVTVAENAHLGMTRYHQVCPDLVLLDLKLPDANGLDLLKILKREIVDVEVIMLTAYSSIPSAVEAIKIGASHYISKPINLVELKLTIDKIKEKITLKQQVSHLRIKELKKLCIIEPQSSSMKQTLHLCEKAATSSTTTVLISGESGTGKEMLAKIVHYKSSRFNKPFIEIDCSAIPDQLLESELFGYEPGAFTDAKTKKLGLLELADGGTLFLDEIGDLSPYTQPKLLRVLENKTFKRLGSVKNIKVDIRIICATNKDLKTEVTKGRFRQDLFYRLQVMPISLPPLRARRDDIPFLVYAFLEEFNREMKKSIYSISDEAMEILIAYNWPGNIRELRNCIERAVILCADEQIKPHHLRLDFSTEEFNLVNLFESPSLSLLSQGASLTKTLKTLEKDIIVEALEQTSGNKLKAAKLLKIPRHILLYRIKKLEIENIKKA